MLMPQAQDCTPCRCYSQSAIVASAESHSAGHAAKVLACVKEFVCVHFDKLPVVPFSFVAVSKLLQLLARPGAHT